MVEREGMIFLGSAIPQEGSGPEGSDVLPQFIELKRANRHGLIAGATGTGKTVSLQILAEGFSDAGVPVFCADIKGDLSGLAAAGDPKPFLTERADRIGLDDYSMRDFPTVFWDLFGANGHSVRTTISEMGPLLLSRLMDLNPTQEGVLNIAFELADDEGLLLLDLKDLRAVLSEIGERAKELSLVYGNVSKASVGAIQRQLLVLEREGGDAFFGEPALDISDLMRTTGDGRGVINVLAAEKLMSAPRLYATFLLWLLSELFEELPEVGDPDKPRLVFFFDEAHLLFDEAPKALLEKVEQIVRLIRSKGVGVYFVTQNPMDVPEKRALAARQPHPACVARLYPARAQGGDHGGGNLPSEPGARHGRRHHRARHRRGARLHARRQGRSFHGGAHADPPALLPTRAAEPERAALGHPGKPAVRPLRPAARPRIRLRDPAEPGAGTLRARGAPARAGG